MRTLSLMIAALAILAGCQPKEDKVIAITFDDGPNVTTTVKMLDMLEENDDVQNVWHNAELPEDEEEE